MNTQDTEPLKPCPFCGGGAEQTSALYDIKCTACGAEINSLSPVRDWNRRDESEQLRKELEELRRWKESALESMAKVPIQEIAKALDMPPGVDIGPGILPRINALKKDFRRALETIDELNEAAIERGDVC